MIELRLPDMPPTTNHAYENVPPVKVRGKIVRGGGRRLTDRGKAFKRESKVYLTKHYGASLAQIKENVPYLVHFVFFFNNLFNKTYPKQSRTRYKKMDATNRVKLLEDVLADVCGIDDSQFMVVILTKSPNAAGEEERVTIRLYDLEKEEPSISLLGG